MSLRFVIPAQQRAVLSQFFGVSIFAVSADQANGKPDREALQEGRSPKHEHGMMLGQEMV